MNFTLKGFIVVLLPLLPNLLFFLLPAPNLQNGLKDGGLLINILEHGGRIIYMIAMVIAFHKPSDGNRNQLLIGMAICLIAYFILWGRYFLNGRDGILLFEKAFGIPVPMAIFPVVYYLLGAIWLNNVPASIAIILFAIGHITNSYLTYLQLR